MLTVFLALGAFVHELYARKIASMAEARAKAWAGAMPGCGGALPQLVVSVIRSGTLDALDAVDGSGTIEVPSWLDGIARGEGASDTVAVRAASLGGRSFSVKSQQSIACNERGDDASGGLTTDAVAIIRELIPGL
jgi:hypothetical protein